MTAKRIRVCVFMWFSYSLVNVSVLFTYIESIVCVHSREYFLYTITTLHCTRTVVAVDVAAALAAAVRETYERVMK